MSFEGEHGASLEPDQKEKNVECYSAIETTPQDSRFGIIVINPAGKSLRSFKREELLEHLSVFLIGNDDESQFMRTPAAITRNGLSGKEYFYVREGSKGCDLCTRGRIFRVGNRLYVLVFVGQNVKDSTSVDAERFLNSFRLRGEKK